MTLYDFCKRMSALTVTLIIICLIIAGCLTSIPTLPIPTVTTIPVRPSATSTSTPIPTKVSTFTPTPVVVLTPVRPTVDASIEGMWSSPNKSWIAALIRLRVKILPNDKLQTSGESEQRTILQVTDSAFTQKWIVEDIPVEDVMGYETAWPLVWSHDGQYLYFTHRPGGGDGCFTAAQFYGTDLLKISLTDGHVSEIVPRIGYWVALSPDESQFAYLREDQSSGKQFLIIRDLATGMERQKPIDELNKYEISHASNLIWSPDGKELVYTFMVNFCGLSPEDESTSIVAVNASTLKQSTLIQEDKRQLQSTQWLNNGNVLLQDGSGKAWWMNPTTGALTEVK